ncbi:hypothetical protein BEH93_18405 [Streptomyces sp. 2R]|nr:hypothetical protein BEH93_18405 [Streptomyces sp. 2R]
MKVEPRARRAAVLCADHSAGTPVSWSSSTAQLRASAVPATASGRARGAQKATRAQSSTV